MGRRASRVLLTVVLGVLPALAIAPLADAGALEAEAGRPNEPQEFLTT